MFQQVEHKSGKVHVVSVEILNALYVRSSMNCDAQCEKMIGFEKDRENGGVKERKYFSMKEKEWENYQTKK